MNKARRRLAKARRNERKFRLKMITSRNMKHVPGTGTPHADGTKTHRVYADDTSNMTVTTTGSLEDKNFSAKVINPLPPGAKPHPNAKPQTKTPVSPTASTLPAPASTPAPASKPAAKAPAKKSAAKSVTKSDVAPKATKDVPNAQSKPRAKALKQA
jgi:hypothetical protein